MTSSADTDTQVQIGGDQISYGIDGPVMVGSQVVGKYSSQGALAYGGQDLGTPCRGTIDNNDHPQAFWFFSVNACGAYGFGNLTVFHARRTPLVGEVTLSSTSKVLNVDKGSAMLLLVRGSGPVETQASTASSRASSRDLRRGPQFFQSHRGSAMVNPFDLKMVLLAKHAQHVVLIHFPIALFITAVAFDYLAQWRKNQTLAAAAYFNLLLAAISTVPVVASGLGAWQWALERQKLKGILLMHLILGCLSSILIWTVFWIHRRVHRSPDRSLPKYRLPIEALAVLIVGLTGHLGGFLSGVNGPG